MTKLWNKMILLSKILFLLVIGTAISYQVTAQETLKDGGLLTTDVSVFSGTANAGDIKSLQNNSTALLQCQTLSGEILAKRKIQNVITLKLIEETTHYIPADFELTLKIKIEYGETLSENTDKELTITYKKDEGVKYNAKQYLSFENSGQVRITIIGFVGTPPTFSGFDIREILQLENKMLVTRYYSLSSTQANRQPVSFSHFWLLNDIGLNWSWPAAAGNNYTQLEWTWMENELESYYQTDNVLNYDLLFANNATRLDLPVRMSHYEIPLLYGGPGRLFFRIRAVNISSSGRVEGEWSEVRSFSYLGHDQDRNWQVRTSFAEEGKSKSVIEYFDGSLRSRQTVTRDNETGNSVIAETMYDGQGRPALQVLPVPYGIFGYNPNLNMFKTPGGTMQGENDDPADFFDLEAVPLPMVSTNEKGAAFYYSPNHPDPSGINKFIPDAEGYPYTLTRYTPDATGRVLSQSGVGAAFKTGSGHETKYYYGSAAQEELDGLFGTDAGNKTHYFKNMVKDANGQMSVSYVDMHGRTIATALAGAAPANLISLDYKNQDLYPNQGGTLITRDLLDANSNIVKGNSVESINSLLVPIRDTFNFHYVLNPESLQTAACEGAAQPTICHDCLYDLEISITEESGETGPVIKKYSNVSLLPDDNCSSATPGFKDLATNTVSNIIDFKMVLEQGSYSIRKTLTVSEASLQHYKELWLQQNVCKTEQELIDSVYNAMMLVSDCGDTTTVTTCQECEDEVGDYAESFKPAWLSSIGHTGAVPADLEKEIRAAYDRAVQNCQLLCEPVSQTVASRRKQMLADMTPGGQYAKLPAATSGSAMHNKYDIFSTQNSSRPRPAYQRPLNSSNVLDYYYDDAGNRDESIHPPATDLYAKLNATSGEDFASQFTSGWANSLLRYHPEYDRLIYSETTLGSAYSWINTFNNTVSFNSAYINAADNDPLYSVANTAAMKSTMKTWVETNYINNLSLWQIARGDVKCKSIADEATRNACYSGTSTKIPPFADVTTPEEKDQMWIVFRNLYSSLRDQQLNSLISSERPVTDETALTTAGYRMRFASNAQLIAQNGWDWLPATPGGVPANLPATIPVDSAQQYYQSNCDAYISNWKKTLLECPAIGSHPDSAAIMFDITAGMWLICQKGTDMDNPYGSSSVSPSTPYDGSPRTFEEVIHKVLREHGIALTDVCNAYVIEFPKPYGNGPVMTGAGSTTIDSCNCAEIEKYKTPAGIVSWGNVAKLNLYLKSVQLDTLTQELYDAFHNNCKSRTLPAVAPEALPDFLIGCSYTCLTCADLSTLILEFKDTINAPYSNAPEFVSPLSDSSLRRHELLARFLNYRTGNNYTWGEYLAAAAAAGCNLSTLADNIYGGSSSTYPAQLSISSRSGNTPPAYIATQLVEFLPGFAAGDNDMFDAYIYRNSSNQVVICPRQGGVKDTAGLYTPPLCQKVYIMAEALATQIYQQRTEALLADFEQRYRAKCLDAQEVFTVQYYNPEYHYTLYYYDMAGSLVKTVPPKGVRPDFSTAYTTLVKNARAAGTAEQPAHELVAQYRYNSLGQVIAQQSPDGGYSQFWYDNLGRLVVSQNEQQAQDGKFSYTCYDALGRIIEVGQKPTGTAMNQGVSQDPAALNNWILTGNAREQLTLTAYDRAYGTDVDDPEEILTGGMTQQNLRNRVSFTRTKDLSSDDWHHTATFYTYDIHGNVDTLLQDYKGVAAMGTNDRFKMIAYDYDLISGKVNGVDYQPDYDVPLVGMTDHADKFFHRYEYDAENRLTAAYTSRDKIVWEREAAYTYYRHGPLARTELGEQMVQGVDYAYTLQGWLKGVNSLTVGDGVQDMGQDGYAFNLHPMVARDVYGFGLHYYDDNVSQYDYKPIDVSVQAFPRPGAGAGMQSLYNGNIAAMSVNIATLQKGPAGTVSSALLYKYRYDQLNRLKTMNAYDGLTGNVWTPMELPDHQYHESVVYDPNGNILSYHRKGNKVGGTQEMDQLRYNYNANTNRLNYVYDSVSNSGYTEDLESQSSGNYTYDKIGNLVSDDAHNASNANSINLIGWTVYGKISRIEKNSGAVITYTYDASGNRIAKHTTGSNLTTIYVRDASGNVMSVYEKPNTTPLVQTELHIYGSSRLGMATALEVAPGNVSLTGGFGPAKLRTLRRGEKFFELSNHLGNVLAVVSDRKVQVNNSGEVGYYLADVKSATDYYPFGMGMVGRKFETGGYRYGFNGKEMDNEIAGDGNQYDYGFRIYNTRLGKFLSVDPLSESYPWNSPYSYAEGDVIRAIDLDGLEKVIVHTVSFAPFDYFGADPWGTYVGNGNSRKFGDDVGSTVINGTTLENFKLRSEVALDLTTMKETSHIAYGGMAKYIQFMGAFDVPLRSPKEAKAVASFEDFYSGSVAGYSNSTIGVNYHLIGGNPAAPSILGIKVNADVDVRAEINFWKTGIDNEIGVNGTVSGDRFPANENYLVDEKNNKLLLGVSGINAENRDNAPYTELPGDNKRAMSSWSLTILFNKDNTFKGVRTPSGTEYSLKDWNDMFIKLNPQSKQTGTNVGASTQKKDDFTGTKN